MKTSFLAVLTVSGVLSFNALAEMPSCGDNCTYTLTENGVDANGNKTYTVTVEPIDSLQPASVSDYSRYGHEKNAADTNYPPWRFENVTEVQIKEGIKAIGKYAFSDMNSITSIELSEGLEEIGGAAFNSTKITSLDLPSTVTQIGGYAFSSAPIEEINGLPDGLQSIGGRAFHSSKFKELVIPESVTSLSEATFGDEAYHSALIENLYCEEAIVEQCEAALQWKKDRGKKVSVIPYKKTSDGQIFYNNKWYKSANDILSSDYAKKRIYTIDEANKITGKKNSVMIRYK